MFSPSPRNRLYTSLASYRHVLPVLTGRAEKDADSSDIEAFEEALARRTGASRVVCVAQCRLGIYLAVKALIEPGQEVILSPYTMTDVINMVVFAKGRPVFADIDRDTCAISPAEVERLISRRTGAVLLTHLHGIAAGARTIKQLCDRYDVPLIEDCAQGFGLSEDGTPVGLIGDVGIFSFEMHKTLATWRGGAVVTNRDDVADAVRAEQSEYDHPARGLLLSKVKEGVVHDLMTLPAVFPLLGFPLLRRRELARMSERDAARGRTSVLERVPQVSAEAEELPPEYRSRYLGHLARIGRSRLSTIDEDLRAATERGRRYHAGLAGTPGLVLPPAAPSESANYMWYPIQHPQREALLRFLLERKRDVAAGHFVNNADHPRFAEYHRDCPNARAVAEQLVYLPTYASYPLAEVDRNIALVREFCAQRISAPAA